MTYDKDSFLAGLSVGMSLRYSKRIPAPPSCLTFSSPSSFTLSVANATKNWDGTLESSTDKQTWTVWDGTTTLASAISDGTYYLYVRGTGNTKITGDGSFVSLLWVLTGDAISCDGDIRSLLNYADVENTVMAPHCFEKLFGYCSALIKPPELPATTLSEYCYYNMFDHCTSLLTAPVLPAMTLEKYCYKYMFSRCDSLSIAPELPALNLADQCYNNMFYYCIGLTEPPALPATTLKPGCYGGMFDRCSSLVKIPALPATYIEAGAYTAMFRYCTKIKITTSETPVYKNEYRIPIDGTGSKYTAGSDPLNYMFRYTGVTIGDYGTPSLNKTYYTSNTVIS